MVEEIAGTLSIKITEGYALQHGIEKICYRLVPDIPNVLGAQRSLLSFQDELAQSDGAVTSNLIQLYKAPGGGWKYLEPTADKSNNMTKDKKQM